MTTTSLIVSLFSFAVVIVQRQQYAQSADIRIPPALLNQPPSEIQYKTKSDIILPCTASGSATLQYLWKKNGTDLDWNAPKITRLNPTEGTISITEATETEAGDYQCYVWNDYGKAATMKTKLVCGQLDDFSGGVVVTDYVATEFQSFQLPCNPPRSVPNATYYWTISEGGNNPVSIVSPDARKQIDSNGNLHFANVKMEDSQSAKKYSCMAKNELADKIFGGSYARIGVQSGAKPTQPPSVLFRSPATAVIGLEGQSVLLRCFFSGYPDPKIEWKRQSGSLPYPRFTTTMFNSGASITGLVPADEGVYMCTGSVDSQAVTENINLTVQAVPKLTETPSDVNASVGDDVTIRCQAYAKPPATIKWYKNTEELIKMPPKFTLSPDRTTLTVSNVQKSYDDPTSSQTIWDLMVIQCTASNTHGSVLAQGYINVLERTVIVNQSNNVAFQPYETVTFDCYAVTDDSTTVTYNWYFNDNSSPIIYDNKTYYFTGNRLYIVTEKDADGGAGRAGKYTCEATNSYSTDRVDILLTTEGTFPVTSSANMIIGIVVGIVLFILLILLLLLIFLYIQRNKGDEYPVDEKERITGNDPEQELLDSGFHDYQRPTSATGANMSTMQKATYSSVPPNAESLNESMPRIGSDEDPSLSAYGNALDYGKFREDGSFLGQYNVNTGYKK